MRMQESPAAGATDIRKTGEAERSAGTAAGAMEAAREADWLAAGSSGLKGTIRWEPQALFCLISWPPVVTLIKLHI